MSHTVEKIGGTSMDRIDELRDTLIVGDRKPADLYRRIFVVSAFGGDWVLRVFTDVTEGVEHVVLTKGDVTSPEPVLVRTHALSALQDVLGIGNSGELRKAMEIIAREGRGVVCLFRNPQARVIREEAEEGPKTVREIGLGSQILSTMGLSKLILLSDHEATRYVGLDAYGLEIVGTRPITE